MHTHCMTSLQSVARLELLWTQRHSPKVFSKGCRILRSPFRGPLWIKGQQRTAPHQLVNILDAVQSRESWRDPDRVKSLGTAPQHATLLNEHGWVNALVADDSKWSHIMTTAAYTTGPPSQQSPSLRASSSVRAGYAQSSFTALTFSHDDNTFESKSWFHKCLNVMPSNAEPNVLQAAGITNVEPPFFFLR